MLGIEVDILIILSPPILAKDVSDITFTVPLLDTTIRRDLAIIFPEEYLNIPEQTIRSAKYIVVFPVSSMVVDPGSI